MLPTAQQWHLEPADPWGTPRAPRLRRLPPLPGASTTPKVDVHHRFGQQLLQPPVLVLEALQALRVRRPHPAVPRLPAIERLLADPVPAADLRRRRPALLLTQHADDLRLAESALPHRPSPDDGLSYQPRDPPGEQVSRALSNRLCDARSASAQQDAHPIPPQVVEEFYHRPRFYTARVRSCRRAGAINLPVLRPKAEC
jgi:hypothetical protein